MPLDPYLEKKILDQWLGNTAAVVPSPVYVGLVLQCGALSAALTAGTSYTALSCAAASGGSALAYAVASGDLLLLGTGTSVQAVTTSASAAAAATSVSVTSFVANQTFATGTPFIRCSAYATAQEPTGSNYGRVSVTNNTTNFTNATSGAPASKTTGTNIVFTQLTGAVGPVAGFLVGDNATPGSGNILGYGALNAAQSFSSGNIPAFLAGQLTVTIL